MEKIMTKMQPNKSPQPTAVPSARSFRAKADSAGSYAIAVHAASRRWLAP